MQPIEPRATEEGGTILLPVPPPLEFPYPRSSAESSAHPSVACLDAKSPVTLGNSVPSTRRPVAPGIVTEIDSPHRPTLANKFVTDRPARVQRGSLLRLKRGQTGMLPAAVNTQAWTSDSDSSSSPSEDDEAARHTGRRFRGNRHQGGTTETDKANNARGNKAKGGNNPAYSRFSVGNDKYKSKGRVSKRDGRLNISVNETANSGYLAKALGATLHRHLGSRKTEDTTDRAEQSLSPLHGEDDPQRPGFSRASTASTASTSPSVSDTLPLPRLNIVIMVIGSRGDIQPFLKVGKLLKEQHGHRVRIATHPAFKKFVEQDSGLEFFSVGGDPAELMAFMVKNPGLVPSISTVRAGEIGRRREAMLEMFQGFWRACINATDDEKDIENLRMMGDKHPFVADAIIANPPSFAHVHCAERLGVPLHLMFTFPYSPTQQFPHPLANIKSSNVDPQYVNFMSYPLVEMMTWQGLGDLVNRFRVKTLGLEPVSTLWAPGQLFRMKVPYTYMWSPGLIPKPADWGPEIDIAGFVFLDLASSFKPPKTLTKFLEAGEPPVYIGFGSIVVDDPDKFTSLIFEAVKKADIRALVSKGWGGLGDEGNTPDNIYMLENTPHDWLFPRVSAVVHHGGAGTTAIGLKCGKPTMIVPFFGDQPFWGAMVARAGAGAHVAIPYKELTADKLAEGIQECLSPEAKEHAQELARDIAAEGDGAANAVKSFHRSLPLRGEHSMRCSILEDHVAVWQLKRTNVRISALAADILVEQKKIKWHDLRLIRHHVWNDFEGPGEPLTGGGAALANSLAGVAKGVGGTPFRWAKTIKKKEQHDQNRKERQSAEIARKSSWQTTPPQIKQNGHVEGRIGGTGNLLHGGQRGPEKKLSAENDVQGHKDLEAGRQNNEVDGGAIGPRISRQDGDRIAENSDASEDNIAEEILADTGAGLYETGEALAKAPMDLALAIAQGFHNAPRLYGDKTVRKPTRISGIQSGLRAAGEEFVYGVYDGWTGLILHPYHGAKEEGPLGLVKGVGKGLGGFVLKDLAAILGPFGYTMKGIHKEIQKGRQPTHFIRKARIIQGQKDLKALATGNKEGSGGGKRGGNEDEKEVVESVVHAWRVIEEVRHDLQSLQQRKGFLGGRVALYKERRYWREHGAFENVTQAEKALQAKRQGRSFDEVFATQMKELKKAQGPRKSTMTRAQRKGLAGKEKAEKEKAKKSDGPEKEKARKGDGARRASGVLANVRTGTEVADKAAGDLPDHVNGGAADGMSNGSTEKHAVPAMNGQAHGGRRLST